MDQDCISIYDLTLPTFIGVPEAERARPQTVVAIIHLYPQAPLSALEDDIARTINYDSVCQHLRDLAMERPRKLLETLGEEIIHALFQTEPLLGRISIELKKSIIPGTRAVAVRLERRRDA